MARLVRRKGKLLRKNGKLTRSNVALNPDAPCECCEGLPPDPATWVCQANGTCELVINGLGFATEAECMARCVAGNCLTFCMYEVALPAGQTECPSCTSAAHGCIAETVVVNGITYCRLYYYNYPLVIDPGGGGGGDDPGNPGGVKCDDRDECCLGSIALANYLGITRQQTIDLGYRKETGIAGTRCPDGTCYPADWVTRNGCPSNPFP